jgi:sec-independent protein translocase protein TatB
VIGSLGWGELLVLAVLGLVIFGPDRLPGVIRDARSMIRELLQMARSAKNDLQAELGPEMADLDLASLHPRRIVRDALLGDDEEDLVHPMAPAATGGGRLAAQTALAPGERPPWDEDAT